ncbi:MAG: 6-bladed beta-propeller [Spirochaetaceae bacterium]|jgi:DNA-binding beta-propeller fold protein YncE|nr:6-bladed beta-propeller [Spirochaetaceae bacterium]
MIRRLLTVVFLAWAVLALIAGCDSGSAVAPGYSRNPEATDAETPDSGPNFLQPGTTGASLTDTVDAQNEFRIGVQAYYRYAFNEAILAFERANSFRPGEPLVLDWLGRAYYRSGLEDTALRQWSFAAEKSSASADQILLRSRIETVQNRRSLVSFMEDVERYVEAGRYPGRSGSGIYFRQPTSVLPLNDGTAWVAACGSNELVRLDVNGLIKQRVRGPVNGFDRPYDVVQGLDGRLYVSEYHGGRVSVLDSEGRWLSYLGERGLAEGNFVGPQNLAVDPEGYLYVVDYGNRRVSKFDPDGNHILSFGKRGWGFEGFLSPTGIVCMDERVFVADGVAKKIYTFDRNGTYLGVLVEEGLAGPESLRLFGGRLLLADTSRIVLIDPDSSIVSELGVMGGANARITGAGADRNGNILAANFREDEVAVLSSAEDLASGFFVQIDRVIADSFPQVTVELSVQDRRRRPILGLDARNFIVTERNRSAAEQTFLGAAYLSTRYDVSVLMERSAETALLRDDLAAALRDINAAGPRLVSVVSAGETPVQERLGAGASGLAAAARSGEYSPRWRFDTALRLAASDLLGGEKKRAVVFAGAGTLGELAFEQYSLSELAAYLANNGIAFYAVIVGGGQAGDELRYLCEETGGEIVSLYQPEGTGPVIRSIGTAGSGSYALRYRSALRTNFGVDYLPVEVEVYLLERSGRDRTGYFAPLQ